jgi:hypothetical protein
MGAGWLLEMGMDNRPPPTVIMMVLRFHEHGSTNSKDQFEYINYGPQKNQKKKKKTTHKTIHESSSRRTTESFEVLSK